MPAQETETGADAITGFPVGAAAPPSSSTVTATTEPFPTLTLPVWAPGLAIEMDTTLPAGPEG